MSMLEPKSSGRVWWVFLPAVCLAVWGIDLAHGQYSLGDGRSLDANLQVGSGGYNSGSSAAISAQVPGRYADAVVTGSVGGLQRFRGRIDYRAPGDFSSTTGSDRTFLFNLRSLPAGPVGSVAPLPIIRRPGSGASAGDLTLHTGQVLRPDATGLEVATPGAQPRLGQPLVTRPTTLVDDTRGRLLEMGIVPLSGLDQAEEKKVASEEEDPLGAHFRARQDQLHPDSYLHLSASLSDDASVTADPLVGDFSQQAFAQMFKPPGFQQAQPGQDSYFDLLRQLGGNFESPVPSAGVETTPPRTPAGTGLERPNGATADKVDPEGKIKADPWVQKLNYDLPPIKTLAGSEALPFNQVMKQAEAAMASGNYFQAEHHYTKAMLLRSGHPMAQAGRAHAQMGSGLYLSAAHNLRKLFTANAVVISARYDATLLPNANRLEVIRETLRQNLGDAKRAENMRRRRYTRQGLRPPAPKNPQTGAALLLAYLAYQQRDAVSCRLALDALVAIDPGDPLEPLLRRLWADDKNDGQPASKDTPAKP